MSLPHAQLDEVRRHFTDFLKARNLRKTPERLAVLDALYATPDHLDADTLYARIQERGVAVSRATVYNTLDVLIECDLAVKHQFGQHQARYERAYAYWQHDHLICLDCHEILEFCDPRLQNIQDTVAGIYGFEVARHALTVYGHCRREACANRAERSTGAAPTDHTTP